MEFKDKLKKLRTEAGLSQEALGSAVHISRSAIAKYENGNGKPSVDTLKALAMYFGVSECELKGDEEIAIDPRVARELPRDVRERNRPCDACRRQAQAKKQTLFHAHIIAQNRRSHARPRQARERITGPSP